MKKVILFTLAVALVLSTFGITPISAQTPSEGGKIVKIEGGSTLYYVASDGNRYVFPNEKTYKTWYANFSNIEIISAEELASYPLKGNIRYRPGVLLIKIQTDPKVYAVSKNGVLRWIKTEQMAKRLYGEFWNELIDDVSASFFTNYSIGSSIDDDNDFDPDQELEDNDSIDKNRGLAIGKILNLVRKANTNSCRGFKRFLCNTQEQNEAGDEDDSKKASICHIPPGSSGNGHTIKISKNALKAHLNHSDTLGACENQVDTEAPVITSINVTASTTSAIINWLTNEESDSVIEYAGESLATASSTMIVSSNTLVTSHSLGLTGLSASTTHFFIIKSKDLAGNQATTTENSFTTL